MERRKFIQLVGAGWSSRQAPGAGLLIAPQSSEFRIRLCRLASTRTRMELRRFVLFTDLAPNPHNLAAVDIADLRNPG